MPVPVPLKYLSYNLCSCSSIVFGALYLTVIMFMALTSHAFQGGHQSRTCTEPLAKRERRLVKDLRYYVQLAGFDLQKHELTTDDGYRIVVDRIVERPQAGAAKKNATAQGDDGDASLDSGVPRYPILLIPGLMQSSAAYCTAGPDSIAFVLHRAGFDVWLGNNRCGFKPRHESYTPFSYKIWDWSMSDLASYDVPAMIEYVKRATKSPHVAVVGHSQGTTQTFMCLAKNGKPDVGLSVSSFCALAPAVYAGPLIDRWFLALLRRDAQVYRSIIGFRAFLGIMGQMRNILPNKLFGFLGYVIFNYMLGWSDTLWDRRYRDRNFLFAPVYVSSKLMLWWLGKGGFADRKCIFSESEEAWFDHRFPKLGLFTCGRDNLCVSERLINRIKTYEQCVDMTVFDQPGYSHLDVLWAKDVGTQIAAPLAKYVWDNVPVKDMYRTPTVPATLLAG